MAPDCGFLVVFEGIDGSGKSTLAARVARTLRTHGETVVETREPTDGPFGTRVREASRSGVELSPEEEFECFHEDRKAHVASVVRPALERGAWVIQDRSYFSTVAYQAQRGLSPEWLMAKSQEVAPRPDVLIVVDVPVDEALARIRARGRPDGFETEATLLKVREHFLNFGAELTVSGVATPERLEHTVLTFLRARRLETEVQHVG